MGRSKGNETTKSFNLLNNLNLNFVGNVEARDLFGGKLMLQFVWICRKCIIKTTEVVAGMISSWLKDLYNKHSLGLWDICCQRCLKL